MKKKLTPHKKHTTHKTSAVRKQSRKADSGSYVVLVRSWVFMVLFALMLGVGVIVGNYINSQLNSGTPTVAGYTTDR